MTDEAPELRLPLLESFPWQVCLCVCVRARVRVCACVHIPELQRPLLESFPRQVRARTHIHKRTHVRTHAHAHTTHVRHACEARRKHLPRTQIPTNMSIPNPTNTSIHTQIPTNMSIHNPTNTCIHAYPQRAHRTFKISIHISPRRTNPYTCHPFTPPPHTRPHTRSYPQGKPPDLSNAHIRTTNNIGPAHQRTHTSTHERTHTRTCKQVSFKEVSDEAGDYDVFLYTCTR